MKGSPGAGRALTAVAASLFGLLFLASLAAPSSAAPIGIQPVVLDAPGEGFNDPVLGPERLAAFRFAADMWGSFFESSFPGETVRVGISLDPVPGDFVARTTNIFARIDLEIDGTPVPVAVPLPIAQHLAGFDPGVPFMDSITFDQMEDFFLGLSGGASDRLDFVSFALHELGHVFGFFSMAQADGTYNEGRPSIYDLFVVDAASRRVLNLAPEERAATVTSRNGLFWGGEKGIAGNGGAPPNLSAGDPFLDGQNVVHLSETFGFPEALMSPNIAPGEVIRSLHAVEVGIFTDLGWTVRTREPTPIPEASALVLISIGVIVVGAVLVSRQPGRSHSTTGRTASGGGSECRIERRLEERVGGAPR
jgi:hypothetical protein